MIFWTESDKSRSPEINSFFIFGGMKIRKGKFHWLMTALLLGCHAEQQPGEPEVKNQNVQQEIPQKFIHPGRDIRVKDYFHFIDSLSDAEALISGDTLNEHILVMANPWIMDTLSCMQYEIFMARDSFVYDQRNLVVIRKEDSIRIPDSTQIANIQDGFRNTLLDLNIPEYRLRIYRGKDTVLNAVCRVGRNERKYLAMAGQEIWLITNTGEGFISRQNRNPDFINPVDNKRFSMTRRDDKRYTRMPLIPWIEPELDGTRYGDLIHPTTNPVTLGKAYSNGCVGVSEADAWKVYFYAPPGTSVRFRYDLDVIQDGESIRLKDIYNPALTVRPKQPVKDTHKIILQVDTPITPKSPIPDRIEAPR